VKRLHIELLLALQLDKTHGRPRGCLGNPLRISVIVLVRLDVGTNILRRHQPNLVALGAQDPAEVVSTAARFHRHETRRQARRELDDVLPAQASAHDHAPSVVETRHTAAVLPKIDPKHRDMHRPLLPLDCPASLTVPDERGGPFHKSR